MAIGFGQALAGDGETRVRRAATDAPDAAPIQMSCRLSADGRAEIALFAHLAPLAFAPVAADYTPVTLDEIEAVVYTATANPTRFRREAVFSGRNHCATS